MRRKAILLVTAMAAALIVASGVAMAVSKVCPAVSTTPSGPTCVGTKSADLLVGTDPNPSAIPATTGQDSIKALKGNDFIRGGGGDDILGGETGNDSYSFADNFGTDTLNDSSGLDTVNLSQVSGRSTIFMVPELLAVLGPTANKIEAEDSTGSDTGEVDLGATRIERGRASQGGSSIAGGAATNLYIGGPGRDGPSDFGGLPAQVFPGVGALPSIAASNDTYGGFTSDSEVDRIGDLGGTSDKLDLRPLSSFDVDFVAVNADSSYGPNDTFESLMIVTGNDSSVTILGYFGHFQACSACVAVDRGRVEQILFSDDTFTSAAEVQSLATTASSASSQGTKVASAQDIEKMLEESKKQPVDNLLDTPLDKLLRTSNEGS